MQNKILNMKGKPLELADLSKPIPLPRVTCRFRHNHDIYYKPTNIHARMLRDFLGFHLYVPKQKISESMNFVTVEIENE